MYITCCLIKLFTLATNTFEEQHRHIEGLQVGVSFDDDDDDDDDDYYHTL
jgi:hypothetical protein